MVKRGAISSTTCGTQTMKQDAKVLPTTTRGTQTMPQVRNVMKVMSSDPPQEWEHLVALHGDAKGMIYYYPDELAPMRVMVVISGSGSINNVRVKKLGGKKGDPTDRIGITFGYCSAPRLTKVIGDFANYVAAEKWMLGDMPSTEHQFIQRDRMWVQLNCTITDHDSVCVVKPSGDFAVISIAFRGGSANHDYKWVDRPGTTYHVKIVFQL